MVLLQNFYLIDINLVGIISLVLAVRLLICFVQEVRKKAALFLFKMFASLVSDYRKY